MIRMLPFTSILLTALAAFAGAPTWVALIGAAGLFSVSVHEHRNLAARFANSTLAHVLTMATWQRAGHALLAGGAAFGIGFISRWALSI
jgi:hypothetical protein